MAEKKKDDVKELEIEQPAPVNLPSVEDQADKAKELFDNSEKLKADVLKDLEARQKAVDDINNAKTPTVKFSDAAGKPLNKKLHLSEEDESKLTEGLTEGRIKGGHEEYVVRDADGDELDWFTSKAEAVKFAKSEKDASYIQIRTFIDGEEEGEYEDVDEDGRIVWRKKSSKNEGLTEDRNVAYSDGWDENILMDVVENLEELQSINYEINNCVKGSHTGCDTYEELGCYIIDVANDLINAADDIRDVEEVSDEDDEEEGYLSDDFIEDVAEWLEKHGDDVLSYNKLKSKIMHEFNIDEADFKYLEKELRGDKYKIFFDELDGYHESLSESNLSNNFGAILDRAIERAETDEDKMGLKAIKRFVTNKSESVKKDIALDTLHKIKESNKGKEFKKLLDLSFKEGLTKSELRSFVEKEHKTILEALSIKG